MGCLEQAVPEETQRFIASVGDMFRLSPVIVLFPKSLWPYLPIWKQFVAAWDYLFKVGERRWAGGAMKTRVKLRGAMKTRVKLRGAMKTRVKLRERHASSIVSGEDY